MEPVHIIGATGRTGLALARALLAEGTPVIPVVRNPAVWAAHRLPAAPQGADLANPASLGAAVAGARRIVAATPPGFTQTVLDAASPDATLILLGSTRRFSAFPDPHRDSVAGAERAFLASGRNGVMLHPTMIYGAEGEQNMRRLARLMRRLPVLPLPAGGRTLVQPIHQDDVTHAIIAALKKPWRGPSAVVIAGPEPVSYADFARATARAAGFRCPAIMPVPLPLLLLAACVPGLRRANANEIRRLAENKAFDITPMIAQLGIRPISLQEGLARAFAGSQRSTTPPQSPTIRPYGSTEA